MRVEDVRSDKSTLGNLWADAGQTKPARFASSLERTLMDVLRPNFQADTARLPVVVQVKAFRFTETMRADGKIEGSFKISMTFKTPRDQQLGQLTGYTTETRYVRSLNQTAPLGGVARRAVENAMIYLSDWVPANRQTSLSMLKGIRFFFKDYTTQDTKSDTVFYSSKHPLSWSDFQATPRTGRLGAAVFSSFSYEGKPRWVNGFLHVELTFKTYMQKSMSWVSPSVAAADKGYSLLHEQRHFDIVKLVVERFKQRILVDDEMDVEDYNSRIQYLYLEAYRDMNRRQTQYDDETQHGLNTMAQESWNRRIIDELRRAEEQTEGLLTKK